MKENILVIEDEPGIADTITYTLDKEGFLSKRVATIAEALDALESEVFSAIVLDVGLPDGNGFDFCKKIRKKSEIPVLFLTARSGEIDKILGLEIGADDYVTKPFSPREVVARLNAILRRLHKSSSAVVGDSPSFFVDVKRYKISYKNQFLDLSRYEHIPLQNYQLNTRAVKYAFLFILLTFITLFFIEIIYKIKFHFMQYSMVGASLVLFYLLLLSLSEHLGFGISYFVASVSTILSISIYVFGITKNKKWSSLVVGQLTILYGFLFVLLNLESLTLVVGAFGLWIVLTSIMYITRDIDWSKISQYDKKLL